MMEAVVR